MIYIVSNGNKTTGGPETLHQIADTLNNHGIETEMVYYSPKSSNVPDRYEKYNVKVANKIIDSQQNFLIVPESLTYVLSKYKKIRKCIAWLSVDNYLYSLPLTLVKWRMKENKWPAFLFPVAFMALMAKGKIHFGVFRFNSPNQQIYHAYNCEYAREYLKKRGIKEEKTIYICGPLNETFFNKPEKSERENIILYNPTKGVAFTRKIIDYCILKKLNAKFTPIQNLTPDEIKLLMSKAKIYIDFGEFPGPERIPREAVIMGCNIITSRNGAAGNEIDVPIPDQFKFNDCIDNIPQIYTSIVELLNNYELYYSSYERYREKVIKQRPQLINNTLALIGMMKA